MPLKKTNISPQRLGWLDTLKGISILAVVIGHIATPLSSFIYVWHVPFFFFLSGITHKPNQSIGYFLRKQARFLLLPYFIFGAIGIGAELLKRHLLPGFAYTNQQLTLLEYLKGLLFQMNIESLPHYGFVLWFLVALFWAKIIALLLMKVLSMRLRIALTLILFLIGLQFPGLLFGLSTGLIGLLWYMAGSFSTKLQLPLLKNKALLLLFFAASWLTAFFNSQFLVMNLAYRQIFHLNESIFLSLAICLSTVMVAKQYFSEGNRWLSWIGQHSLILLIVHPYLNNLSYFFTTVMIDLPWYIDIMLALLLNLIALIALQYGSEYSKKILSQLRHPSFTDRL